MEPVIHNSASSATVAFCQNPSKNSTSSRIDSTKKYTPGLIPKGQHREQIRQEIIQGAKQGTLGLRTVVVAEERKYLKQNNKMPRPVYLILEPVPVQMRSKTSSETTHTLGILKPEVLAAYKRNAKTVQLAKSEKQLDELDVKCLSNSHELQTKMREQAERRWDIYPGFTSGHIKPDGTFKPSKLRQNHNDESLIPYCELLSDGYETEQIKCYCIAKEDFAKNITDILREKQILENTLEIKSLPLLVYGQTNASIEVYFDDELSGKQLALHESQLENFALSQNIGSDTFKQMLNILPMSVKSEILNLQNLEVSPDILLKKTQIIKLVTEPECYRLERLLEIKASGTPLHERFFHNGKYQTLLDLLLDTEMERCFLSRPINGHSRTNTEQEMEANQLFRELVKAGSKVTSDMALEFDWVPPGLFDIMKAMGLSTANTYYIRNLISQLSVEFPGIIVAFDQRCKRQSQQELQKSLETVLQYPFQTYSMFNIIKPALLALFHYGANLGEELLANIKTYLEDESNFHPLSLGGFSKADFFQWVQNIYLNREQDPFYQHWPEHVEQAKQTIAELRISLDLQNPGPSVNPGENPSTALQFVVDAFGKPPVLSTARDNEQTILSILQHYYRRPGPERVVSSLALKTLPEVWKPLHPCSHVLRARNNALWYMELLAKFQLLNFTDDEKTLLALATIYHDAAAEDVGKNSEEEKSAGYFKRDLAGQFPQALLDDIALALESKEIDVQRRDDDSLPESVRRYLRVLRFADRMDIIRCTGVGDHFPGLTEANPSGLNPGLLDLPPGLSEHFTSDPEKKPGFQRHLEAAMHGAADLAQVTGHLAFDHRPRPYAHTYQLKPGNKQLTRQFERTPMPVRKMDEFMNDNVRRKIASLAGINTCSTPDHKACQTDTQRGTTRGIHNSWYDLKQVRIPGCMTRLEKMQCQHDMKVLSQETQQAIETEVRRLISEGIPMNLGTLTQETLRSLPAKRVLEQRGVAVVSEKRRRGYDETGNVKHQEILVPVKQHRFSPD